MRRKAKELQQARRDAERQGKKAPGFGGFGSSAVSGGSTAAMITETIIETDKPKVAPAPARYCLVYHQQPRMQRKALCVCFVGVEFGF